jgi:hypothetical protein
MRRRRLLVRLLCVIAVVALADAPAGAAAGRHSEAPHPNATLTPDVAGTTAATVLPGAGNRPAGADSGHWTAPEPAAALAGATAPVLATWPDPVRVLWAAAQVLLLLAPLLLGIYLLDRLCSRSRLWPPWRGLR